MSKRKSVYIDGFKHVNPIPNACRVGSMLVSGVIGGCDLDTDAMPASIVEQSRNLFSHVRSIVEAGGGTTGDIIKLTVWLKDKSQRDALNREWLKMFPNENDRPARHVLQMDMDNGALIQCDVTAVIG